MQLRSYCSIISVLDFKGTYCGHINFVMMSDVDYYTSLPFTTSVFMYKL